MSELLNEVMQPLGLDKTMDDNLWMPLRIGVASSHTVVKIGLVQYVLYYYHVTQIHVFVFTVYSSCKQRFI
jgi:hypothetical protein